MKTVNLKVAPEIARRVLGEYEKSLSEKVAARNALNAEIAMLETDLKSIREQLQSGNGDASRTAKGENKAKITAYLRGIPGNKGAKTSDIANATGVSLSSVYDAVRKGERDKLFVNEGMLWKMKHTPLPIRKTPPPSVAEIEKYLNE